MFDKCIDLFIVSQCLNLIKNTLNCDRNNLVSFYFENNSFFYNLLRSSSLLGKSVSFDDIFMITVIIIYLVSTIFHFKFTTIIRKCVFI